jgi:phage replication-related protein YjqB (UPF0714/DUF867 family)
MLVEYIPASSRFEFLICATHAATEIGTDDVARHIQKYSTATMGLYVCRNPGGHPQTIFQEPLFNQIVQGYHTVISIHGMTSTEPQITVDGLNTEYVERLRGALRTTAPASKEHIHAQHSHSVANRGSSGRGAQIEITSPLLYSVCPIREWIADTIAAALVSARGSTGS